MNIHSAIAIKPELTIGYDGNPPELVAPRDIPGEIVRELPERENNNSDRIHWLFRHDKIDRAHYFAAKKLQADAQVAQIGGFVASGAGSGGRPTLVPSNLADAKLDAIARINAARAAVPRTEWRLIEMVVLENIQVTEAGRRMFNTSERGVALKALRYGLDKLAEHMGLA